MSAEPKATGSIDWGGRTIPLYANLGTYRELQERTGITEGFDRVLVQGIMNGNTAIIGPALEVWSRGELKAEQVEGDLEHPGLLYVNERLLECWSMCLFGQKTPPAGARKKLFPGLTGMWTFMRKPWTRFSRSGAAGARPTA